MPAKTRIYHDFRCQKGKALEPLAHVKPSAIDNGWHGWSGYT